MVDPLRAAEGHIIPRTLLSLDAKWYVYDNTSIHISRVALAGRHLQRGDPGTGRAMTVDTYKQTKYPGLFNITSIQGDHETMNPRTMVNHKGLRLNISRQIVLLRGASSFNTVLGRGNYGHIRLKKKT